MKLHQYEQIHAYRFLLSFENGEIWEADLKDLIGQHVTADDLHTAYINSDWGCLEFLGGQVDIEPKTLYRYAHSASDKQAAREFIWQYAYLARSNNQPCREKSSGPRHAGRMCRHDNGE